MKRIMTIISAILICGAMMAQPNWAKKASKSVFTLKTFTADGTLIASSNGFFIDKSGVAVSNFAPFNGAARAVIVNEQGKEMNVECILGANEIYDVVKFRVATTNAVPLAIAASAATDSSSVWLVPYSANKKMACVQGKVSKVEKFQNQYNYYTIAIAAPENSVSCPLLNDNGEVIGLLQQPSTANETTQYAVSARFADSLKINGLSINDATLKKTSIKKALPDQLDQAVLTLYLAGSIADSVSYTNLLEDFIAKFPNASDGYIARAQLKADANKFAEADKDMEQAIKVADKKDDAHYNYARLIYNKEIYKSKVPYANWSMDKAADEADKAYQINKIAIYMQLKAQIRFSQKNYSAAYDIYKELTNSGTRTAEVYFNAARCKEMLNDTTAMVALLDSAVNTFSKPYLKEAAPYILARAQAMQEIGKYREAVGDYNDYEKLMSTQVNDNFYYARAQVEAEGRMFQLAINDINKAIKMSPKNTLYYAEKASIEVRVGLFDDAIKTAQECISIDPKISDGYLFLGLAQCLKGNKTEGAANLQKAKELGDGQAQALIDKYSK